MVAPPLRKTPAVKDACYTRTAFSKARSPLLRQDKMWPVALCSKGADLKQEWIKLQSEPVNSAGAHAKVITKKQLLQAARRILSEVCARAIRSLHNSICPIDVIITLTITLAKIARSKQERMPPAAVLWQCFKPAREANPLAALSAWSMKLRADVCVEMTLSTPPRWPRLASQLAAS